MTGVADGPPTPNCEATTAKEPHEVARMFDHVAPRYDLMNALLSLGQSGRWRRATTAALAARPGELVLDVAAGTGTSTQELARSGAQVLAVDRSKGMIDIGHRDHPEIPFLVGEAGELPFADAAFDAVTISFGLRNMPDPVAVLRELARVTKSGGRLVVCEFSTPSAGWLRLAHRTWLQKFMPLGASLSSSPVSYRYLAQSILDWPSQAVVTDWMQQAGWRDVAYKNLTGGVVALHLGRRP